MKILIVPIFITYIILMLSCNSQPSPPSKSEVKKEFSINNRIKELRESGELLDSCQFPYQGNCIYRLCGSKDLTNTIDSSMVNSISRILVTYVPSKLRLITDENNRTAHLSPDFKIYSNIIFKEYYDNITFKDFVSKDVSESIEKGEIVSKKEEIPTSDTCKGIVYEFKTKDQYFAISYINISKYIIMIVYAAKDRNIYNIAYKHFFDLVSSFKYYGD